MPECKKPCAPNQICNKESGKCVSRDGRIGRKITGEKAPKAPKQKGTREGSISPEILKKFKKVSVSLDDEELDDDDTDTDEDTGPESSCSPPCPPNKICNPKTKKCVLRTGRVGKALEKGPPAAPVAKPKKTCSPPCPPNKICNPETGKCVLKTGRVGMKIAQQQKDEDTTEDDDTEDEDDDVFDEGEDEDEDEDEGEGEGEDGGRDIDPSDIMPLIKMTPADIKSKCILDSKTKLVNPQAMAVEYFNTHDSLLVVFETGVGKTLTAIATAECYLKQHPKNKVVVITSKTLLKNFDKEFAKYGTVNKKKYSVYTYQTIMNMEKKKKPLNCANTLLIIDEVHTLRNYEGKMCEAAMECAMKAHKVLLLTATPYVNTVCDFIPLINLISKSYIIRPSVSSIKAKIEAIKERIRKLKSAGKGKNLTVPKIWLSKTIKYTVANCKISIGKLSRGMFQNQLRIVSQLLQGRIAFAEKAGENYPATKTHDILIPMSDEYERRFEEILSSESSIFENPDKFANGYRRAVNSLGADNYINGKMKQVIKIIEDDTSKYARNIIFSSWIKFGTKVLTKILTQKGITFAIISGETKSADRDRIVKEYNAGKINTLIITMAGSTGIDLKGVQNIIILDPVWNPATLEQIIGRGVRYKSHSDLPLDKRIVNVYRLMYVEKAFLDGKKAKSTSGDFILYTIIERKMKNKDASSEAVRRISIF